MGDLVKAVKKEAPVALYFWWGVKASAVTRWRRALGVELSNPGTRILREAIGYDPRVVQGLKKAHAKANDPVRRAKISVANKGRKVSDKVRKRLSELRTGTKLSAETRRKIGETYRKRGHLPVWVTNPWTPEEDELVRALDPDEVAKRTGRPLRRVHARRYFLGVTRERGYNGTSLWTPEEDELVRTLEPKEVVKRTGRPLQSIYDRRHHLGVTRERGYNGTQK
jgi:hypothetical protein